jgi:integrase
MVDKLNRKYLYQKREVFYFSKQVPQDLRYHYAKVRIVVSLKTKSIKEATHLSQNILLKLNQYWFTLRINNGNLTTLPMQTILQDSSKMDQNPKLSNALQTYFKLKGIGKGEVFFRASRRAVNDVIALLKDRSLNAYSTTDAARFRDHMIDRGLVSSTVKRVFAIIRAIINLSIQEHGLSCKNAFAKTYIPDLEDTFKRQPIPINIIRKVQEECVIINDPNRWLIALISDTGMRLSEALGLKVDDLKLYEDVPYVNIVPNSSRQLKTKSSERKIPLVGLSLWAAQQISANRNDAFAFPHYTNKDYCSSNSASAALNKWLKSRVPERCVIHSFRHSMRDRLREVNCPTEMIDQIGGWSDNKVGSSYGNGYSLAKTIKVLSKIVKY